MADNDKLIIALGVGTLGGAAALAYYFVGRNKSSSPSGQLGTGEKLGLDVYGVPSHWDTKTYNERLREIMTAGDTVTDEDRAMLNQSDAYMEARAKYFIDQIYPRAEKVFKNWMNYATAKWGPDGFAASIPTDKIKSYDEDRWTFDQSFYNWYGSDEKPGSWRARFQEYQDPPATKLYDPFRNYWRNALRDLLDDYRIHINRGERMLKKHLERNPGYVSPDLVSKK